MRQKNFRKFFPRESGRSSCLKMWECNSHSWTPPGFGSQEFSTNINETDAEAEAPVLWPPDNKDSITDSMDTNLSKLQETVKAREACCAAVHRVAKSWTHLKWLNNKTLMNFIKAKLVIPGASLKKDLLFFLFTAALSLHCCKGFLWL